MNLFFLIFPLSLQLLIRSAKFQLSKDYEIFDLLQTQTFRNHLSRNLSGMSSQIGKLLSSVHGFNPNSLILSSIQNRAYLADNNKGLVIIGVTNLESPSIIGFTNTAGVIECTLSQTETTAFCAGLGFIAVNVNNPSSPSILSSIPISNPYGLTINLNNTLAYVSSQSGLNIVNITNQESSSLIKTLTVANLNKLALSLDQNYIYAANGASGVAIINVENSLNPSIYKQISAGTIVSVKISSNGQTLYALDQTGSFKIYDISNPASVASSGSTSLTYPVEMCLDSNGKIAVVADSSSGVRVINIESSSSPTITGTISGLNAESVAISNSGSYIFVADKYGSLSIYSLLLNLPNNQSLINSSPIGILSASDVVQITGITTDGYLLAVNQNIELMIVSISTLTSPQLYGYYNNASIVSASVSSDSQTAFLACASHGVEIISISNRNSPTWIATISTTNARQICVSPNNQLLYIADGTGGLKIYNITTLSSPTLVTSLVTSNAEALAISSDGKTLFLADASNLIIINVANPSSCGVITTMAGKNMGRNLRLSANGNTIFLSQGSSGVLCISVANVSAPYLIRTFPSSDAMSVDISSSGSQLLIADSIEGLQIYDISNLNSPNIESAFSSQNGQSGLFSSDDKNVFLADGSGGLKVYSMMQSYSLNIQQYYTLGNSFTTNMIVMVSNQQGTGYNYFTQSYKFTEFSLYSLSSSGSITYGILPSWITADLQNVQATFFPNSESLIGNHYFYVQISTQIPQNAFVGIGSITTASQSESLIFSLISTGYMDSNQYLTSNFDPSQTLNLESQYQGSESQIRSKMATYQIGMVTQIGVYTSLTITIGSQISISTPSTSSITAVISLNNNQAEFLKNVEYPASSAITQSGTQITFMGSLIEINRALKMLRVNLESITSTGGTITVYDGLNPSNSQSNGAITNCFIQNTGPQVNIEIQSQIEALTSGTSFNFPLDSNTFIDSDGDALNYTLMTTSGGEAPSWISLKNLNLAGTAPQTLSYSISLKIIASDGYKTSSDSFTLTVKASFAMMLSTYGPYIIAGLLAVLLISNANQIYNIFFKPVYQHPKKFQLKPGSAITDKDINPFRFISSEVEKAEKIFNRMKQIIQSEMGIAPTPENIVEFFTIDGAINHEKLSNIISSAKNEMISSKKETEKLVTKKERILPSFFEQPPAGPPEGPTVISGSSSASYKIIKEFIFEKIINMQIGSSKENKTAQVYEKIKGEWTSLVELEPLVDSHPQYIINTEKFNETLAKNGVTVKKEVQEQKKSEQKQVLLALPKLADPDSPNSMSSGKTFQSKKTGISKFSLEDDGDGKMDAKDLMDFFRGRDRRPRPLSPGKIDIITSPKQQEKTPLTNSLNNLNEDKPLYSQKANRCPETDVNIKLLEDALICFARGKNTVNFNLKNVDIISLKRLTTGSRMKKFLKKDMKKMEFSCKGKLGFGIKYKIKDKILHFYGKAHEDIEGESIVVQIINKRGRILKEFNINGEMLE